MANHSLPATTSTYTNFVTELDGRLDDLAVGLDPATTTATNIPTGSLRWNSANKYWEKFNGTTWAAMSSQYSININGTVGATTPAAGQFTSLTTSSAASLAANSTVNGQSIVNLSDQQTLTNKTLTSPKISSISIGSFTFTLPTLTANDTAVGENTTNTLTNKTLTTPKFANAGYLSDQNGSALLQFSFGASAVNALTVTSAASGSNPQLQATGTDPNISLNLVSKGTGTVQANGVAVATTTGTQTFTNKTLTTPTLSATASGITSGVLGYSGGNFTYGDGTSQQTVANISGNQTFTNKTMSTQQVWNGNIISVQYGGTGTSTAPTAYGVIYAQSASAYASTGAGSAYQVLQSNATSAPSWVQFDMALHMPGESYKKTTRVATTGDLGASTYASSVLTGYQNSVSLAVQTTASSTTATTTSTAGIKVGAVISANANIPAQTTVASIVNSTTFTLSAAATATAQSVSTTFTQTIQALQIDGTTLAVNDRVLVKDMVTMGGLIASDAAKYNGIYYVSATGQSSAAWTLTRATDSDAQTDLDSAVVNVSVGTANGGKTFKTYFTGQSTLGTTPMYWNRVVDAAAQSLISTPTTTRGINIDIQAQSLTAVAGQVGHVASNSLGIATIATTSAQTYTTASSLYIAGAPVAGANTTITTPYALFVAADNTYLGGDVVVGGGDITIGGQPILQASTVASNVSIFTTTTGTITIGSTSSTAVQLPSGKTKVGNTTITQGGSVNITLPATAGTLARVEDSVYLGSTAVALNRASGALSLTDVSISGNAGTVSNGVYTTGSYADPAWITQINYTKLTGTVPTWNQNTTGNAATVTNGVYTTGNQTINGTKTFGSTVVGKTQGTTDLLAQFSGTSTGGQYASMWDRRAGPFYSYVATTGSQYAPVVSAEYNHNGGWNGVYQLGVLNDNAASAGSMVIHHLNSGAGQSNTWRFQGATGDFVASGGVTAYQDENLKEDWSSLQEDFIVELSKVKQGTYTRKDTGQRQVGVQAQSLQKVSPEAVLEGEYLQVSYGNIALAACIELAKEVVQLRKQLNKLLKED